MAVFSSIACAQGYPNKPVRVIISFTPGSSTDIVGRLVMQKVSEYWGQPVIADNRGGAGGKLSYVGDSAIIDPLGEVLASGGDEECIVMAEVDPSRVSEIRTRFPFLADRR